MKKTLSLILTTILLFSAALSGCTGQKSPEPDGSTAVTNNVSTFDGFIIEKAEYPQMAAYPENEFDENGNYDETFDERLSAWRKSREEQNKYSGSGKNLEDFFTAVTKEFIADAEGDNTTFSPLNVYMALAMLAEVTGGNTRAQILDLLGSDNIEKLRTQAASVWNANYCDDKAVTQILASSIWLNKDIEFKDETLKTLAESYYADSFSGDTESDEFSEALRNWLDEKTGGLLKDQVSGVKMDPATIMALATTIYYKAGWANAFSERGNTVDIFHGINGDTECTFMNNTERNGKYYHGENFSAASLSLQDSGSMYFILPDEGVDVNDPSLTDEYMKFLMNDRDFENPNDYDIYDYILNISVPKFDVSANTDLAKIMKNLGVTDCFDTSVSDYSPLTDGSVCLSSAEHAARVKIDEEGVEAAAYTVMMLAGSAMAEDPIEIDFVLDRPFVFVIMSTDSLPLFIGVVNNM